MSDEKSLTVVPEVDQQALTMQERMGPSQLALRVWTTLDTTTDEGKAAMVRHMAGGESARVGDNLGEVIDVQDIIVHSVEGVSDDGEEWTGERIVFISPDEKAYACVSRGMVKSLQLIMGLYGVPPWKPALRLKIQQINTRRGNRTYTLTPIATAAPKGKAAK